MSTAGEAGIARVGRRVPPAADGILPEGGYACWLEEIPEAISQGDTLEEARANLRDALALVMEQRREEAREAMSAGAFEEERASA